jgi:outer membrane protein TolC
VKTWFVIGLGVLAALAGSAAEVTNRVAVSGALIQQFAVELAGKHPSLQAAHARAAGAAAGAGAVRTWNDPQVRFGGSVFSDRGADPAEDGDLLYGLQQNLPLFGKAAASRRVAEAEAITAADRAGLQFQSLRRHLVQSLLRAALASRVLDIGREDLVWLDAMTASMEERYRAGTASQVELLRLQNERARRTNQLRTDALHRDHEWLTLNRLLGRELHGALPEFELPAIAAAVPYTAGLIQRAVEFEPALRTLRSQIVRADASVAAVRRSRLPEMSAGIEGRQFSGDGGFREGMFSVSLTLPWFNRGKYRSDLQREQQEAEAARQDAANQEFAVREEIHHLTVNLDAARREALLFRDEIAPRSELALTAALNAWASGRGMLPEVLEARRMTLEARLSTARSVADQLRLLADLAFTCGFPDYDALLQGHPAGAAEPHHSPARPPGAADGKP